MSAALVGMIALRGAAERFADLPFSSVGWRRSRWNFCHWWKRFVAAEQREASRGPGDGNKCPRSPAWMRRNLARTLPWSHQSATQPG